LFYGAMRDHTPTSQFSTLPLHDALPIFEELTESLARHGIPVARYHGRLSKNERDAEQARFMAPRTEPAARKGQAGPGGDPAGLRSEEHTSELQSRENVVCRLLLEKKSVH